VIYSFKPVLGFFLDINGDVVEIFEARQAWLASVPTFFRYQELIGYIEYSTNTFKDH
jgi:hypothetical protein